MGASTYFIQNIEDSNIYSYNYLLLSSKNSITALGCRDIPTADTQAIRLELRRHLEALVQDPITYMSFDELIHLLEKLRSSSSVWLHTSIDAIDLQVRLLMRYKEQQFVRQEVQTPSL